jgi:hypothetical protein
MSENVNLQLVDKHGSMHTLDMDVSNYVWDCVSAHA